MDFFQDTWYVLDEYFKTNYFLTKHHLDSYNDFINSKLRNTIKVLNPFTTIKNENEINIYVGGKEGTEIFINKPTIIDLDGTERPLYPNEARLKNLTYKSDIFADIYIEYKEIENNKTNIYKKIYEKKRLGSIPIMLHSCLCILNNQPKDILHEMGECIYDQGGYFIIDGKEKVIVAQERIATNRVFINKSKDDKFSYEALIRSTSEDNPLFPKTIYIHAYKDTHNYKNSIAISSPNIDIKLPLFILFRLFGVESDKEIIEYIVGDIENNKEMVDYLRYSLIQSKKLNEKDEFIYTQNDALNYVSNFVKYKNISKLKDILINDIFPNVGKDSYNEGDNKVDLTKKALFLGHVINKFLKVCLGITPESDRDSYIYKRVDISGFLISNLFRDYYNQFRQEVMSKVDSTFQYSEHKFTNKVNGLITDLNFNSIFKPSIIDGGFKKSLKGSWGVNMVEEQQDTDSIKEGLVQDLSRFSYLGFMSHLRRVNTPIDPTSKIVDPHRLHPSQWGIMCPCESPDGGSIGLLKNFAILCNITFDSSPKALLEILKKEKLIDISNVTKELLGKISKVFINSNWIGMHDDPHNLLIYLRLLKRNSVIDIYTSISWNVMTNELHILTESGRCCRPVYVVENGKLLIASKISELKQGQLTWDKLTRGYNYNSKTKYNINSKDIDLLKQNQSIIEYIDVEESNSSLIAMHPSNITELHTHCEIHPSTILSILTHNIPLANHNQAPRNIFSGAQGKQAIGCYATNYNNRIDTMSYILHYPQKCLVNTKFCEYLNINNLPNGENLIVALATYGGYNMEDAIIMNKNSIERGMFNLTYFKNIVDKEEENKRDNEVITFNNPNNLKGKDLNDLKFGDYSYLDENGLPKLNTYIKEGCAIIGKTKIKTEVQEDKIEKETYYDRSLIADKTISGLIDKVYIYLDDENKKNCKIRFRKIRIPELGDKCCCYDEETEILTDNGWKFFKDLKLQDKVATIVNDSLIYQNPSEIQKYPFEGKLYQVKTNQVDLKVTDNHRMYVRTRTMGYKIKEANDIYGKIVHYKKNINNWKPDFKDAPTELLIDNGKVIGFMIDGYTDKNKVHEDLIFDIDSWLIFFGIWIAEGCTLREDYVSFSTHKKRVKEALHDACNKLNLEYSIHKDKANDNVGNTWIIKGKSILRYMLPLSVGGNNKYLPEWVWFLDREQCRILIHGMLLGDGDFGTCKQGRYYTTSTILADQFQRLCLHAGFSANKALKAEAGHTTTMKDGSTITTNADYWVLSVIDKQNEPIVNKYMYNGKQKYDGKQNDSWVDYSGYVWCCTVPEGDGVVYVRRNGVVVWCGQSRHAQKGVIGMIIPQENMPFTKDGIVPDIIINPHAIPSRMTIAHLLETLLGKISTQKGIQIDGTPFNNNDYSKLFLNLEKDYGFERYGNEIMYNGQTGDQIESSIYIGPTYYERLKHMVSDKINYRQVKFRTVLNNGQSVLLKDAPVSIMTRQPTKGRGNNGGLRIGEMEKDSILSHGMSSFLKESLMERSDKYDYIFDKNEKSISNKEYYKLKDPSKISIPYAFKQFIHEITALGIKPELYTEQLENETETYDDAYIDMFQTGEQDENTILD